MPFAALAGCDPGFRPNGSAADAVVNVVSHEQNETMTDPLGTAWWDDTDGSENGDLCSWNFGPSPTLNDGWDFYQQAIVHFYDLQEEWSNRAGACVLKNTFVQPTASFVSSASPVHGSPVTFTSTAADTDLDVLSYAWNFGDGSTSTATSPSHTYAAAGSRTVTLVVTDTHGDQVRVIHTIVVA